jgi:mandelate racemase
MNRERLILSSNSTFSASVLSIRSLAATAVKLPMKRPLGTSAKSIDEACLLLIDLVTRDGITGHGYAFCYQEAIALSLVPVVNELGGLLAGQALAPLDLASTVSKHFKLPGLTGPLAMVASSVDTAAWDALAKSVEMPLSVLLGGSLQPIPAYNSNGLGLISPEAVADEAEALLGDRFTALKLRLGRREFAQDLAAVRAVRRRLPDNIRLMVDFNQALTFANALRSIYALDSEGIYWIEEPIRHDDYRYMALLAQAARTPLQMGENFTGLGPMAAALEAGSSDYLMLDLDRIGGVTGWMHAAGLAAAYNREVSSHLFPEVSAHLLAATPGRHWLEYVDWAEEILLQPLQIEKGMAIPFSGAGNGLAWNADAVARYRLN